MQIIIFPRDNGVAVVYPAPEYADRLEHIAKRDVPVGKPWRIIDAAELPPYDARNRWRWTSDGPLHVAPVEQFDVPAPLGE